MGAYTPLLPTGLDQGLVPEEVMAKYFTEVLFTTDFTPFMGNQPTSAIQVDYKKMGTGASLSIPFRKEIDYKNPIKGDFAQISGKGQNIQFYSDNVTVGLQAIPDRLPGVQFMELDTPVKIFDAMKPVLQIAHQRNIIYSLLQSATTLLYPDFTTGPTADRVVYSGVPYNASIRTSLDAMAANTSAYNSSGLSVNLIRIMRDMAIMGGVSFGHEKKIAPIMLSKTKNAWVPTYVYLMDTISYRSLCQDPDWKIYFGRGTIESADQPSGLTGSFYRGMIDNIQVFECMELGDFQQTSAQNGGARFSWNLFMGAQAFYLLWGKMPWFVTEQSNMNTIIEMAILEIRGQKPLMFPSFNNSQVPVESGLIHSFVNITGL